MDDKKQNTKSFWLKLTENIMGLPDLKNLQYVSKLRDAFNGLRWFWVHVKNLSVYLCLDTVCWCADRDSPSVASPAAKGGGQKQPWQLTLPSRSVLHPGGTQLSSCWATSRHKVTRRTNTFLLLNDWGGDKPTVRVKPPRKWMKTCDSRLTLARDSAWQRPAARRTTTSAVPTETPRCQRVRREETNANHATVMGGKRMLFSEVTGGDPRPLVAAVKSSLTLIGKKSIWIIIIMLLAHAIHQ